MQLFGCYGKGVVLFIVAAVVADAVPKRTADENAEPASFFSRLKAFKPGDKTPREKPLSAALIIYGDTNKSAKRNHIEPIMTIPLSVFENGSAIPNPVPVPGPTTGPVSSPTKKPTDWDKVQRGVEGGLNAFHKLLDVTKHPTARNVVALVQSIVGCISTFVPEIAPFATALFGIIDILMPNSQVPSRELQAIKALQEFIETEFNKVFQAIDDVDKDLKQFAALVDWNQVVNDPLSDVQDSLRMVLNRNVTQKVRVEALTMLKEACVRVDPAAAVGGFALSACMETAFPDTKDAQLYRFTQSAQTIEQYIPMHLMLIQGAYWPMEIIKTFGDDSISKLDPAVTEQRGQAIGLLVKAVAHLDEAYPLMAHVVLAEDLYHMQHGVNLKYKETHLPRECLFNSSAFNISGSADSINQLQHMYGDRFFWDNYGKWHMYFYRYPQSAACVLALQAKFDDATAHLGSLQDKWNALIGDRICEHYRCGEDNGEWIPIVAEEIENVWGFSVGNGFVAGYGFSCYDGNHQDRFLWKQNTGYHMGNFIQYLNFKCGNQWKGWGLVYFV